MVSGVLPIVSGRWSPKAKKYFHNYVEGRSLMALCHTFQMIDRSWHMEIVDCAKTPKLNINIALSKEDFIADVVSYEIYDYLDYYRNHLPL